MSKAVKDMRFYNWCFTSFEELPPEPSDLMNYMIYQREKCPESGKLHYQGYVEFKNKYSMNKVKEILGSSKIHLEVRKGTQLQAVEYCRKADTRAPDAEPYVYGKLKKQGNRSDLDAMYEMARQHATVKEMLKVHQGNGMRHIHCYEKAALAFIGELQTDKIIKIAREIGSFSESDSDVEEEKPNKPIPKRNKNYAAAASAMSDSRSESSYETESDYTSVTGRSSESSGGMFFKKK